MTAQRGVYPEVLGVLLPTAMFLHTLHSATSLMTATAFAGCLIPLIYVHVARTGTPTSGDIQRALFRGRASQPRVSNYLSGTAHCQLLNIMQQPLGSATGHNQELSLISAGSRLLSMQQAVQLLAPQSEGRALLVVPDAGHGQQLLPLDHCGDLGLGSAEQVDGGNLRTPGRAHACEA
jgi:hypothetical protein